MSLISWITYLNIDISYDHRFQNRDIESLDNKNNDIPVTDETKDRMKMNVTNCNSQDSLFQPLTDGIDYG